MSEKSLWLYERFSALLSAAMDRNIDAVGDILAEIGEHGGADGVFATCFALADAIRRLAFPGVAIGDGTLTGDIAIIEVTKLADDPATDVDEVLWAARFTAAYINGDTTRCADLFFATLENDNDQHIGGIFELIHMAADIARIKEAELS